MSYTDQLAALADLTDRQVQALYTRFQAGEITAEQFIVLASAVVAQGESRAVSMADVALATTLSYQLGHVVAPVGLLPEVAPEQRVTGLVREALDDVDPPAKLTVNVRSIVLETAQRNYGTAMKRQGVKKWTRKLNAGACEVCQDLAGDELPAHADMWTHKGCSCTQNPITERKSA